MDARFKAAADIVLGRLAQDDLGERTIACHRTHLGQLGDYLDGFGLECGADAVTRWIEEVEATSREGKLKECRATARAFLEALEGDVAPRHRPGGGSALRGRLEGWAASAVDRYVASLESEGRPRKAVENGRRLASEFLLSTAAKSPEDLTPDAISAYAASLGGGRQSRTGRLFHAREVLIQMAGLGEVCLWLHLLVDIRFLPREPFCVSAGTIGEVGVMSPDDLLSTACGPLAGHLRSSGYSDCVVNGTVRALKMLALSLALDGENYGLERALAWADIVSKRGIGGAGGCRRAVLAFESFRETGCYRGWASLPTRQDPMAGLPEWSRAEVSAYAALRRREGLADSTVSHIVRACARLANHADSRGIASWSDVDAATVSSWSSEDRHSTAVGRARYVTDARGFLWFLEDEGIARPGVSLAARPEHAACKKVVVVLDDSQVAAARESRLSARTPMEMRDAAMVALGLTMGLRACDVVSLELSDISWKTSTISIVQSKTGVPLTLPLTPAAGNSLAAYIEHGRPSSPSPLVFVKHKAPFDGMRRGSCRKAVERCIGENLGFHILRRTFATSMLRGGAGRDVVADALGHAAEGSTGPYLSLDEERMRMCALSLSECGIEVVRHG